MRALLWILMKAAAFGACFAAVWITARKRCSGKARAVFVVVMLLAGLLAMEVDELVPGLKDSVTITAVNSGENGDQFRHVIAFSAVMLLVSLLLIVLIFKEDRWEGARTRYFALWRDLKGWKFGLFYTLHYTLLFLLLSRLVFAPYLAEGKSFVFNYDGVAQHLPKMVYVGQKLREGIRALLAGQSWSYPTYDFQKGIVTSGLPTDLLYFLLCLVPTDKTVLFYHVYILLIYYAIGLAFSYFGLYFKQKPLPVLAAAISYAFCGHALNVVVRHMMFGVAMALLPLLIVGADKVLRKEPSWLLLICVFLSLKTGSLGIYFSCMSAFFVVLYLAVRLFDCYETDRGKEAIRLAGRLLVWGGTGVLLAGFSILPSLLAVGGTGRVGVDVSSFTDLAKYSSAYYEEFITEFAVFPEEFSNYTTLGFSVLCLPAVALLFLRRERRERALRILFVVLTILLLSPAVTYVMSGFSHLSNRYIYGYAFCVSAILMFMLPKLAEADRKTMLRIGAILLVYAIFSYFAVAESNRHQIVLILLLFAVMVFQLYGKTDRKTPSRFLALCLAVSCLSVSYTGYLKNSPNQLNYVGRFVSDPKSVPSTGQYYALSQNRVVKSDESVFRVAGDQLTIQELNSSPLYGLYGISAYSSTGLSPAYSQWLSEMELPDYSIMLRTFGLDTHAPELSLAGIKYFAKSTERSSPVPYGFEKISSSADRPTGSDIYVNENALPLGYTYSRYILRENYDALQTLAKQETQLKSVVLEETPSLSGYISTRGRGTAKCLEYAVKNLRNVTWDKGFITVGRNGGSIELSFEGVPGEETYLRIVDLDLTSGDSTRQFLLSASTGSTVAWGYFMADAYMYADGKHTQMLNLGRSDEGFKTITISFPNEGTYRLGGVEIWSQPMNRYASDLAVLREESLENIETDWHSLKGTITVASNKILCLAIPYSKGWTAWVDGVETKLYRANTAFMAVELTAGTHAVELRYSQPGLSAGIAVSALGLLCALGILAVQCGKKRARRLRR